MGDQRPIIHPYVALLLGVCFVSSAAVMVKLSSAPAAVVAAYRMFFTILLMTPFMLLFYRAELLKITKKDWLYSSLSGFFLALHFVLWFESLHYTSVASSVVLVTLQPLFTFLGGYFFFQEKIGVRSIVGGALAIMGSVIICWGDFRLGGMAILGNVLALLGATMVSGYWLFGQHVRKRLSLMTYTYVVYGTSTGFIFIYVFSTGQAVYGYSLNDWLIFLALAIFPTLLGHSVFNWALKWVSASLISMTILLEPVGASILAYFVLGEILSVTQWMGGVVIILGIYLFIHQYEQKQQEKPNFGEAQKSTQGESPSC